MTKIYIVYTDAGAVGYVFDSKEKLLAFTHGDESYEIDEIELNETNGKEILPYCQLKILNGDLIVNDDFNMIGTKGEVKIEFYNQDTDYWEILVQCEETDSDETIMVKALKAIAEKKENNA